MGSNLIENGEVSMLDVLNEDNELEAEANAVLGDSDDQNCTYVKGCVKRQALYSCLTCIPAAPAADVAGMCLACSLSCHDGHELVELYTKRNFRCDCGNDKFDNFKCKLLEDKDPSNQSNKYNQNFKGVYCSCSRPYPDPDDEIEDEMIQCIVCEDWYHSRHLGNLPPVDGEFSEMICDNCMDKFSFLHAYSQYSEPSQQVCTIKNSDSDVSVDVESIKPVDSKTSTDTEDRAQKEDLEKEKAVKRKLSDSADPEDASTSSPKKICKGEHSNSDDHKDSTSEKCNYQKLLRKTEKAVGCTYWKNGWRSHLCACETCMQKYKDLDVAFLLDDSDTISAYEDRGKTSREEQRSSYESSLSALDNLNRVQQMEILHGYNDMKTELTNYLAEFAKQRKTVTEEDIRSFFQRLQSKKKNNSGPGNFQHFCR